MTQRILIVDDDPDIIRALTRGLERRHYEVVCAAKADSAYSILENQHIDAVVLDLLMPQIAGDVLALAITRKWPRMVGRIILMSGDPLRGEQLKLRGAPFPFLAKPFTFDQLCRLIDTIERKNADHSRNGTTDGRP
jgi:two-component system KDP operon response regulator KdpE